jgi:hypothetical protein
LEGIHNSLCKLGSLGCEEISQGVIQIRVGKLISGLQEPGRMDRAAFQSQGRGFTEAYLQGRCGDWKPYWSAEGLSQGLSEYPVCYRIGRGQVKYPLQSRFIDQELDASNDVLDMDPRIVLIATPDPPTNKEMEG